MDADLANNTFGWQWVAGCGADAAPYFRIFNPAIQAEKFDSQKEYLRRWVSELATGEEYPSPIVDHHEARDHALAALASPRTHDLSYVTARHPGLVHVRRGVAPQVLESGGIPVGLLADTSSEERTLTLGRGDRLYFFTDGLTEAENTASQEFSLARLLEAFERNRHWALEENLAVVIARTKEWCAPARPAGRATHYAAPGSSSPDRQPGVVVAAAPAFALDCCHSLGHF